MKGLTHAIAAVLMVGVAAVAGAWSPQQQPATPAHERDKAPVQEPSRQQTQFMAYDIVIDTGTEPLAAWQVEIKDELKHARIVGIEGGQSGAYSQAPHYDPKAIQGEHVIIGAFTTGDAPSGKVRVARLHVMAEGGTPRFATVMTAAAAGGRKFDATLSIQPYPPADQTRQSGDGQ